MKKTDSSVDLQGAGVSPGAGKPGKAITTWLERGSWCNNTKARPHVAYRAQPVPASPKFMKFVNLGEENL